MKPRYIVSACLLGEKCKYNGESNYIERLDSFRDLGILVGVCPEVLGGFSTPRVPCEIVDGKVVSEEGIDVSEQYSEGANLTLKIANIKNIHKAILKEKSPSCGSGEIYDGTFTHTLTSGDGVTVQLLKSEDFRVYGENQESFYDAIVVAAGSSKRSSLPHNKVFEYSKNSSCLEKAVEPFLCDYLCNKVIVVGNKDELDFIKIILNNKRVEVVEGGSCREESVLRGLEKATKEVVLIHDAARPYLDDELKDMVVDNMIQGADNVVLFVDSYEGSEFDYHDGGRNIQTPQAYYKDKLISLMKTVNLENYRDESSIYKTKYEIKYLKGSSKNKKITTYQDVVEWREYQDEDNL